MCQATCSGFVRRVLLLSISARHWQVLFWEIEGRQEGMPKARAALPDDVSMASLHLLLTQAGLVQRLDKLLSCRLAMLQLLQHLAQHVREHLCCAASVLHVLHAAMTCMAYI